MASVMGAVNELRSAADENQPTRWRALLFSGKAWLLRLRRWLRNPHGRPQPLPQKPLEKCGPLLAESRGALYGLSSGAEFALQAGKVQNLRLAAGFLHGRVLPAGEM